MALDAGGTMTDCVIIDDAGRVSLGKALTDCADESTSFLDSARDAAAYGSLDLRGVFSQASSIIYAGTIMLNTILSYSGQRVGLLVTQGMEDYLTQQRAEGSWLGLSYADRLHSVTHYNKPPYVPRRRIRGVRERTDMTGRAVIPLRDEEVSRHVAELLGEGIQALGIVFVFASLNPAHEKRAKSIAEAMVRERGLDVAVVTSSELVPTLKEYTRLTSVVLQTYAAEPSRKQFQRVDARAKEQGFRGEVQTLLAHGGVADISHPRLYEAFVAGPIGGILGAKYVGDVLGLENIVATDVGGTSFDVGIIRQGAIPVEREPVLLHNRVSLPMIHTVSIGAGTGSELAVNPITHRLEIGPKSAGPDTGRCYRHPRPTISDCNVALGYLNPDFFLGGTVKLDRSRAIDAVSALAAEFGKDPYEFAAGILDVLHETMRQHVTSMILGRGYDVREYSLFAYGGGGPMHLWGYQRGMEFRSVVTFPFAAVFSAFGVLTTDRIYRYHKGVMAACPPGDDAVSRGIKETAVDSLNAAWEDLRSRALTDLAKKGLDERDVAFQHYAYVRYGTQINDFEVPLPFGRIDSVADLSRVVEAFERVYTSLYPKAGCYPEAGYLIMEVALSAAVPTPRPHLPRLELRGERPSEAARKGQRRVWWSGEWLPFQILDMERVEAGNVVPGPAIFEDPATTLVVPPGRRARFDDRRFIWFEAC